MKLLAPFVALALGAGAFGAPPGDLPPLNESPSSLSLQGKIVWADLHTSDPGAAVTFYTGLFGWTATRIQRPHAVYTVLSADGNPVAGIAVRTVAGQEAGKGRWIPYIAVSDVPRTLSLARKNGARVILPAKDLAERGTQALFLDPQGAPVGILQSSSGDPPDYEPQLSDWAWAHVSEPDPQAACRFYQAVFGYDVAPDPARPSGDAFILSSQGMARAGLSGLPNRPQAQAGWLLLVRVADVNDILSRAGQLGGRVLVEPKSTHPGSRLAIIADPLNAVFGVIEMGQSSVTGRPAPSGGASQP